MKSKALLALIFVFVANTLFTHAQNLKNKYNLRVLYVGGNTDWQNDVFPTSKEREKDIIKRSTSFERLLNNYFTNVKVIDAKDYNESISHEYDVTVMDGTPKVIAEAQPIKDENGRVVRYHPAGYLTEDFKEPMIFIGETGAKLGGSIGLKIDGYCLCLDDYAHSIRSNHAIFKGPFPVNITIEQKSTPEEAFHYQYFLNKPLPSLIPMWKVQTKGYSSDKGFGIGMVARPWGFEDSPEAEYISGGVSTKTIDAVAIGRHGNYFHWGFAASPTYMTPEAQAVFANSIVYISKFKNKGVIARKYLDRRATKDYIKELKYLATKEAFDNNNEIEEKFNLQMLAEKKKAEEKNARKDTLSAFERQLLAYQPGPKRSFEEFLKRNQKDLYNKFGVNTSEYKKYYEENKDFFYADEAYYKMSVDEDVKSLGIPNTDKRLLAKCISLLEKGEDIEKAERILHRYTLLNFKTAAEWKRWFEKNKNKIFFTQSGGFYFMVDSYDRNTEGNNYKKDVEGNTHAAINPEETDDNNPVSVAAGIINNGPNKKLIIKMKIHHGYHIYAFVADSDPYIATALNIDLPEGYQKVGELTKPSFKYFNSSGTSIYEDEIVFSQEITGVGEGVATCNISYQSCDNHICFPPVDKELTLQL